jgi:hypothetical protein
MTVSKLRKKLENPFALVAQGFVAGVILFWATMPEESNAAQPSPVTELVASSQPASH